MLITLSVIIGLATLAGLFLFQIALIAGAPIGRFAWGGQHDILPRTLRISSGSSLILYGVFAAFLLEKAGWIAIINNPTLVTIGMWVITGYFVLGIVVNAVSRSRHERALMTPVAALLAVAFLIVSLS